MSRSACSLVLAISLGAFAFAISPSACPAQNLGTPTPTQTSQQASSDYGPGGKLVQQTDQAGGVLEGTVYDPAGTERHDEKFKYSLNNGKPYKVEKDAYNFDFKGHLDLSWKLKYDFSGTPVSSDITHYGLHGERTWEEITDYKPTGYEIRD